MPRKQVSRKKYKKQKKHRMLQNIFKLMVVITVVVALTIGATVFFKVEEIKVTGNVRYTEAEVVEASAILEGDNLFQLNLGTVEAQIEEELPYVEDISIRRVLPNAVSVTMTEWDAVACIKIGENNWLMSIAGKLLEMAPQKDQHILIQGLNPLLPKAGKQLAVSEVEEGEKFASLLELLGVLEAYDVMGKVSVIDLSANTSMTLRYDERFDVIFPLNGDYDYELRALEAAVADREIYETGEMDLTNPDYGVVFSPNIIN